MSPQPPSEKVTVPKFPVGDVKTCSVAHKNMTRLRNHTCPQVVASACSMAPSYGPSPTSMTNVDLNQGVLCKPPFSSSAKNKRANIYVRNARVVRGASKPQFTSRTSISSFSETTSTPVKFCPSTLPECLSCHTPVCVFSCTVSGVTPFHCNISNLIFQFTSSLVSVYPSLSIFITFDAGSSVNEIQRSCGHVPLVICLF